MVAGLDDDPAVDHSPQSSTEAVNMTQTEIAINSDTPLLASEKQGILDEKMQRMALSGTAQHTDTWFSRWRYTILRTVGMYWQSVRPPRRHQSTPRSRRLQQLVKMTTTRRLVTTLARLLHSKSEVVTQIRKRLGGQDEVAIYLDDVQGTCVVIDTGIGLGLILSGFCRPYHYSSAVLAALRARVVAFTTRVSHIPPSPNRSDQKHHGQDPCRVVCYRYLRRRHEPDQGLGQHERPRSGHRGL